VALAQQKYKTSKGWLLNLEVHRLVSEHFDLHSNGTVVDLVVQQVVQGNQDRLQDAFGLTDERFSRLRQQVDSHHVQWQQMLQSFLEQQMSLNLANAEVVDALVGLTMWQLQGHTVDLPKLTPRGTNHV